MKRPLIFVTLLFIVALFLQSPKNTLSFICERHVNPPGYAEWCYFTAGHYFKILCKGPSP